MPGVIRTRVGYTGGHKASPTYHSLGDHTESLQLDFDPARISYEQLLSVFWDSHDPAQRPYSTQYKAAVYYAGEQQRLAAEASLQAVAARLQRPVQTQLLPVGEFYRAEDYHQKYYLRHEQELWLEAEAVFGTDARALADSTLAARLNGYAGHFGQAGQLDAELASYGLSRTGQQYLRELAPELHTGGGGGACAIP